MIGEPVVRWSGAVVKIRLDAMSGHAMPGTALRFTPRTAWARIVFTAVILLNIKLLDSDSTRLD